MNNIPNIDDRKKIWFALSGLFLDTDIATFRNSIVRACAESSYSIAELHWILKNEVSPACAINLFCVAGEWQGFNEEWLEQRIAKVSGKNALGRYIQRIFFSWSGIGRELDAEWSIISDRIRLLREGA